MHLTDKKINDMGCNDQQQTHVGIINAWNLSDPLVVYTLDALPFNMIPTSEKNVEKAFVMPKDAQQQLVFMEYPIILKADGPMLYFIVQIKKKMKRIWQVKYLKGYCSNIFMYTETCAICRFLLNSECTRSF